MSRRSLFLLRTSAAFLMASGVVAYGAEPPPPAPAPGTPGTFVSHTKVDAQVAAAMAAGSDPAVARLATTDQYTLVSVQRTKPTPPPAIHPGWNELHLVIEGSATFVTGGKIVTPPGTTRPVIEGGVSQKIEKGDFVMVPPNTPHWYQEIGSSGIRAVELRFPAATAASAGAAMGATPATPAAR